jgi:hypothetical protein
MTVKIAMAIAKKVVKVLMALLHDDRAEAGASSAGGRERLQTGCWNRAEQRRHVGRATRKGGALRR